MPKWSCFPLERILLAQVSCDFQCSMLWLLTSRSIEEWDRWYEPLMWMFTKYGKLKWCSQLFQLKSRLLASAFKATRRRQPLRSLIACPQRQDVWLEFAQNADSKSFFRELPSKTIPTVAFIPSHPIFPPCFSFLYWFPFLCWFLSKQIFLNFTLDWFRFETASHPTMFFLFYRISHCVQIHEEFQHFSNSARLSNQHCFASRQKVKYWIWLKSK